MTFRASLPVGAVVADPTTSFGGSGETRLAPYGAQRRPSGCEARASLSQLPPPGQRWAGAFMGGA
jgi:hypothetical protein